MNGHVATFPNCHSELIWQRWQCPNICWDGFQSLLFIPFGCLVWSWWIQNCSLRSLRDFEASLSGSPLSASIISHFTEFTVCNSLLKWRETGESLLYFISAKCSPILILNWRFVCPTYCCLQILHVSMYTRFWVVQLPIWYFL